MDDRQRAIEFAKAQGYAGFDDRLTKFGLVCGFHAIESVEFTEGVERAIVTRVVPYSEVPSLLSPLTLEMVDAVQGCFIQDWAIAIPLWTERDRAIGVVLNDFAKYVLDRLRQQIEGDGDS